MKRMMLRRTATALSLVAFLLGGATVPASAAVDSGQPVPMCWHDRCPL